MILLGKFLNFYSQCTFSMGSVASIISNNLFVYRLLYRHRRFTATKRNTGPSPSRPTLSFCLPSPPRYTSASAGTLSCTSSRPPQRSCEA